MVELSLNKNNEDILIRNSWVVIRGGGWKARHFYFILFYSNYVLMICRAVDFLSSNLTSEIILPTRFEFSNVFLE